MSLVMLILQSLYFFLPAYLANMVPVLVKKVPFLSKPVWERKLGNHKTWRGFVFGILVGTAVFCLQQYVYLKGFTSLALISYPDFPFYFGTLLGLGALVGDAVKSYYKRKLNLAPGTSWMPWDQLDFVLGGLLFGFFVYVPSAGVVLILIVISPLLHIATNYIGYLLKINKNKF